MLTLLFRLNFVENKLCKLVQARNLVEKICWLSAYWEDLLLESGCASYEYFSEVEKDMERAILQQLNVAFWNRSTPSLLHHEYQISHKWFEARMRSIAYSDVTFTSPEWKYGLNLFHSEKTKNLSVYTGRLGRILSFSLKCCEQVFEWDLVRTTVETVVEMLEVRDNKYWWW